MDKQEITIAYGKEVQLTTIGKKNKQVFLKFSPAFRYKQLKLLKGTALSVFICYALHTDENGYCFPDSRTITRETGVGHDGVISARKILFKNKFISAVRLVDNKNKLRDWVYRIFQPIEMDRMFIIRGVELFPSPPAKGESTGKPYVGTFPTSGKYPPIIEEELNNLNKEELLRRRDKVIQMKREFLKKKQF